MRWFRFLLVLCVVAILNAGSLLNVIAIPPWHIKPDLLLILLVFMACSLPSDEALVASFLIGFTADTSGVTGLMGPYTIAYTLFGGVICQLRRVVLMRRMIYQGLTIFLLGMLIRGLALLLMLVKGRPLGSNAYAVLWGTAAYSAFLGPFFWIVLVSIGGWLGLRDEPSYRHRLPRR